MRSWALRYLRCPRCSDRLELHAIDERDRETISGLLVCADGCRTWYPIADGVPRMLHGALRSVAVAHATDAHRRVLADLGLEVRWEREPDRLESVKRSTMASFGFEWTEFRGFGWDDPIFDLAYEEGVFLRKSLLNPPDLDGQLVLDAGCGNGRYSYWAARHGQWVFGVDLGDAVDAAARNTAEFQNIQIVQGDIFGLPFAPSTFDIVFSIGVLMHTGDARTAFESLVPLVALGGSLSIHVYGKGNPLYETVDRSLRARTTKLAIPTMERFTERAYRLRRLADRVGMARALNRFVRLDSHPVGFHSRREFVLRTRQHLKVLLPHDLVGRELQDLLADPLH